MKTPDTLNIRENVPLAPLTTLGLGGPARWHAACSSLEDLRDAFRFARARQLRHALIGGGSNVIVPDTGFDGLAITMNIRGINVREDGDDVRVTAAAGEPWDEFVARTVAEGWGGIECLSGIPGLVGATPIQNVGAYGQEVADSIAGVEVMHRETLERRQIAPDDCAFGYRTSAFKQGPMKNFVVLNVTFRLQRWGTPAVKYPELVRLIESLPGGRALPAGTDGLKTVRNSVLQLRRRKSMVLDPADPHTRSAGSFFTNPLLTSDAYEAADVRWKETGSSEPIPSFPAVGGSGGPEAGRVKVPAAWLVEHTGFRKGYREGNVGISANHALALVNYGGTTRALLALADRIQQAVRDRFGISLEREPVILE